jgi:hypothetical protein
MRLLGGCLALAALLLGGSGAEAGLFGKKDKLPKPIDSPVLRPKVKESHKIKKSHHPSRYQKDSWGATTQEQVFRHPSRPVPHYLNH